MMSLLSTVAREGTLASFGRIGSTGLVYTIRVGKESWYTLFHISEYDLTCFEKV